MILTGGDLLKKYVTMLLLIAILVGFPSKVFSAVVTSQLGINSKEETYQDIVSTLISPYIQTSIQKNYKVGVSFDLFDVKYLEITRLSGDRKFTFIIKIQVKPFIGAHNTVGIDNITYKVEPLGEFIEISNEHIKDFPLP